MENAEQPRETLAEMYAKINATPQVLGLWFVDAGDDYKRFRTVWDIIHPNNGPSIPVLEWRWEYATKDELTRMRDARITFLMTPGIWLEMSSGDHARVTILPGDAMTHLVNAIPPSLE